MDLIIGAAFSIVLLVVGFLAGSFAERRHFRRLEEREAATGGLVRTQSKLFLAPTPGGKQPTILCGESVIASDYFKNFLAGFRKFFGGEMGSYHSLMERARRETLTKLLEQAQALGYNAVCNVRLEPADIGGNSRKKASAMVCIVGTATAYDSDLVKPIKPPEISPQGGEPTQQFQPNENVPSPSGLEQTLPPSNEQH